MKPSRSPVSTRFVLRLWIVAVLVVAGFLAVGEAVKYYGDPEYESRFTAAIAKSLQVPQSLLGRMPEKRRWQVELVAVSAARRLAWQKNSAGTWAELLLRETDLRVALEGYGRTLKTIDSAWAPQDAITREFVEVLHALVLAEYFATGGVRMEWDALHDRSGRQPGFEAHLRDAHAAWAGAFARRDDLSDQQMGPLSNLIVPGTPSIPSGIRDTARDALTYLYVAFLCNPELWRAEDFIGLQGLDPTSLMGGLDPNRAEVTFTDPGVHPLQKACAALDDLERWHALRGHEDGAVESLRQRRHKLSPWFGTQENDALRATYETRLATYRRSPWWSFTLAELAWERLWSGKPGTLAEARSLASEGMHAHPGSHGSKQCEAVLAYLDDPTFRVEVAMVDGLGRPSFEVIHKNVRRLYFRAWRTSFDKWLTQRDSLPLFDERTSIRMNAQNFGVSSSDRPDAEWFVDLPPTPDSARHRTLATPRLRRQGLYFVSVSDRPYRDRERDSSEGVSQTLLFLATDIVALVSQRVQGNLETRVVSGRSGTPVSGVKVSLLCDTSGGKRGEPVTAVTDSEGHATLQIPQTGCYNRWVVARHGESRAVVMQYLTPGYWDTTRIDPLSDIVTNRASLRPGELLYWKTTTLGVSGDHSVISAQAGLSQTVSLTDGGAKVLGKSKGVTSSHGSLSGTFALPLLPQQPPGSAYYPTFQLRTELGRGYGQQIQLSPSPGPRPTAVFRPFSGPSRLGQRLSLVADVRDGAGDPVQAGAVWWWAEGRPEPAAPGRGLNMRGRTHGLTKIRNDGTFSIEFIPWADRKAIADDASYKFWVRVIVFPRNGAHFETSTEILAATVAVASTVEPESGFFEPGSSARIRVLRRRLDGAPAAGIGTFRVLELQQPGRTPMPTEEPPSTAAWERPGGPPAPATIRTPGDSWRPRTDRDGWAMEAAVKSWKPARQVQQGTVMHDAKGSAVVDLGMLRPGAYRFFYETLDEEARRSQSERDFFVVGSRARLRLPLALLSEGREVRVGGKARFYLDAALPNQLVVVEIWKRGRLERATSVKSSTLPAILEFPIAEADRGEFAVRAWFVRDHQYIEATARVRVDPAPHALQLALSGVEPEEPMGTRIKWFVTVSGAEGTLAKPGSTELLAYLVERGDNDTTQPQYSSIRANIASGSVRDIEQSLKWTVKGNDVYPQRRRYPEIPDRFEHSRGFMFSVLRQGPDSATPRLREEIQLPEERPEPGALSPPRETAFWLPRLVTGMNGTTVIEETLPNKEAIWDFWVYATTPGGDRGWTHREVRTRKPTR